MSLAAIISQCLPHQCGEYIYILEDCCHFFFFFFLGLSRFLFTSRYFIVVIMWMQRDLHNEVTDSNYRRSTHWRMIHLYFEGKRRTNASADFSLFSRLDTTFSPPTTWTFIWKVCGFKYIYIYIHDIHWDRL